MKSLKTKFRKNDMFYEILERTDNFYFAELRSTDTKNVVAYESGRIIHSKENTGIIAGNKITFDASEAIVSNEKFGQHPADRAYTVANRDKCYKNYLKFAKKDKS